MKEFYFDELVMSNILSFLPKPKRFKDEETIENNGYTLKTVKRTKHYITFELRNEKMDDTETFRKRIYKDEEGEYIKNNKVVYNWNNTIYSYRLARSKASVLYWSLNLVSLPQSGDKIRPIIKKE